MALRQGRQPEEGISREEQEQELAALLSYSDIARSANMVRMLRFICEKYFAGRVEDIRESAIAVQALGRREAAFDSQADPIVRVTARMLRKRLDAYYRTAGCQRSLRLHLPVGRYVPQFERVEQAQREIAATPRTNGNTSAFADCLAPDISLPVIPETTTATQSIGSRDEHGAAGTGLPQLRFTPSRALSVNLAVAAAFLLACLLSFWAGRRSAPEHSQESSSTDSWGNPVWQDEFDGAAGARLDASVWNYQTGKQDGWGNKELQMYCAAGSNTPPCAAANPNVYLDGEGHLVLRALRTATGEWTSARINTSGHKEFQYGRIEARMKLPVGAGLWPAFWMIGSDGDAVGWPQCGSVDFVENISNPNNKASLGPTTIRSTIHGPGYSLGNGLYENYLLSHGAHIHEFHVYGAIWSPNMIQLYVDDPANVFFVRTASDMPAGTQWVLNNPFSLVLNLAVGGIWPGPPDESTPSPADMLVDYVRAFQVPPMPAPEMSAEPVTLKAGASGSALLSLTASKHIGRVYLACSGAPPNASCSPETSVVNFADRTTQQIPIAIATTTVAGTRRIAARRGEHQLTITAYTTSGDTAIVTIPLRIE